MSSATAMARSCNVRLVSLVCHHLVGLCDSPHILSLQRRLNGTLLDERWTRYKNRPEELVRLHMQVVNQTYPYTCVCQHTMHHIMGPYIQADIAKHDYHTLLTRKLQSHMRQQRPQYALHKAQEYTQQAYMRANTEASRQYDMAQHVVHLHDVICVIQRGNDYLQAHRNHA